MDVADRTWIDAPPIIVAAEVADRSAWRRWWPRFRLTVTADRGRDGVQWRVESDGDRGTGSMEIWLEPQFGGVVLHWFLRLTLLDLPDGRCRSAADAARIRRRYEQDAKQLFWPLKDRLESSLPRRRGPDRHRQDRR